MASMPEKTNAERREFFRINDRAFVELDFIQASDLEALGKNIGSPKKSDSQSEKVQLDTIQSVFNHLTDTINQSDREVARALRMLDEKINLIAQAVRRQQSANTKNVPTEVNLSAGGIAFLSHEQYQPKDAFEITIELMPSGNVIHAICNVVACTPIQKGPKNSGYHLRLVFTHMSEYDRNSLVKHTLTRQAEILRAAQSNN